MIKIKINTGYKFVVLKLNPERSKMSLKVDKDYQIGRNLISYHIILKMSNTEMWIKCPGQNRKKVQKISQVS
jgi:hypothetical protein